MKPISQRDVRWANEKLGFSKTTTISSHGCLITCLAYLAGVDPSRVNQELKTVNGYVNTNLVNWGAIGKTNLGLQFYKRVRSYNNEDVKNNLPCIVEVDGKRIGASQHFVVYVGNGQMMDPWTGVIKSTSYYPATGYAIVKKVKEPTMPDTGDIRLKLLDDNNIKSEGDLRAVLDSHKRLPQVNQDLDNCRKELEELKKIHESVKNDFKIELQEAEDKNKIYRDFVVRLAKAAGTNQNIEDVETKLKSIIKSESELQERLKNIQDNRPVVGDNWFISLIKFFRDFINYFLDKNGK